MKRLSSVISVEEKPAMKKRRTHGKRRAAPSSSFTNRNDISSVFNRMRSRQSAAKSLPDAARDPEASTRLFISNIADEVPSLSDIIELLFKQIGRLRRHKIHCDPEGHFQGTAEVVYERWDDAVAAARHYDNNIKFFERTWKVELVGEKQILLAAASGACKQTIQSRLHECGSSRGGGGGKRAPLRDFRKQKRDADLDEYYRERRPARGEKRPTLREALDADLDRYHKDAQVVKSLE